MSFDLPPRGMAGLDYAFFCRPAESVAEVIAISSNCRKTGLLAHSVTFQERNTSGSPDGQRSMVFADPAAAGMCPAGCAIGRLQSIRLRAFHTGPIFDAVLLAHRSGVHQMTYVNAGQAAPMLLRKSATLERLNEGGHPIGLLNFSVQKVHSESSRFTCEDLIQRVLQAADAYAVGSEQSDDMTVVALRIR